MTTVRVRALRGHREADCAIINDSGGQILVKDPDGVRRWVPRTACVDPPPMATKKTPTPILPYTLLLSTLVELLTKHGSSVQLRQRAPQLIAYCERYKKADVEERGRLLYAVTNSSVGQDTSIIRALCEKLGLALEQRGELPGLCAQTEVAAVTTALKRAGFAPVQVGRELLVGSQAFAEVDAQGRVTFLNPFADEDLEEIQDRLRDADATIQDLEEAAEEEEGLLESTKQALLAEIQARRGAAENPPGKQRRSAATRAVAESLLAVEKWLEEQPAVVIEDLSDVVLALVDERRTQRGVLRNEQNLRSRFEKDGRRMRHRLDQLEGDVQARDARIEQLEQQLEQALTQKHGGGADTRLLEAENKTLHQQLEQAAQDTQRLRDEIAQQIAAWSAYASPLAPEARAAARQQLAVVLQQLQQFVGPQAVATLASVLDGKLDGFARIDLVPGAPGLNLSEMLTHG